MAVRQGAWFRDASHPAETDRLVLASLLNPHPALASGAGITGGAGYGVGPSPTELQVTQRGAGANMSVDVAAGTAHIDGTETGQLGIYVGNNDGTVNLPISASHATLARKDLIVARVKDSEFSGVDDNWALEVVTGTPATGGTEVEPAAPASSIVLAVVAVAASAASITNANITDRRRRVSALGGIVVCTSATRPTVGLYEGLTIYETDTDKIYTYTGSAWVQVVALGAWDSYTPTLVNWTLGAGSVTGRWTRSGRTIDVYGRINFGTGLTKVGTCLISLPVAAGSSVQNRCWARYRDDDGAGAYGFTELSSDVLVPFQSNGVTISSTAPFTWAAGDSIMFEAHYEAAS